MPNYQYEDAWSRWYAWTYLEGWSWVRLRRLRQLRRDAAVVEDTKFWPSIRLVTHP